MTNQTVNLNSVIQGKQLVDEILSYMSHIYSHHIVYFKTAIVIPQKNYLMTHSREHAMRSNVFIRDGGSCHCSVLTVAVCENTVWHCLMLAHENPGTHHICRFSFASFSRWFHCNKGFPGKVPQDWFQITSHTHKLHSCNQICCSPSAQTHWR